MHGGATIYLLPDDGGDEQRSVCEQEVHIFSFHFYQGILEH